MLTEKKGRKYLNILTKNSFLIEYSSLFLLLLIIPLFIGKPQLVVGTLVNTILIYSTLRFGFKKTIPFLVLPSCMAYMRGLLFGSVTIFLVYLIPFIILSNGIYCFTVSKVKSRILGIILGSIFKASFLYLVVNVLINTVPLPKIFLTTMGINQLITALIGGILSLIIFSHVKVSEHFSK
jgi:hypothetical protein